MSGRGEAERAVLVVSDRDVDLQAFVEAARGGRRVKLSTEERWRARLHRGREVLERALAAGEAIYGVNTGFGYSSFRRVPAGELDDLAAGLVRQHGCGVGEPFSPVESRAIVLARLVTLAKGFSAVRPALLERLAILLDRDIVPVIPRWGSVGASGDLTPLSYVAAALAGERDVYWGGRRVPASLALAEEDLEPWRFAPKESLALMNGTAAMTAVGILAHDRFVAALRAAERATALLAELVHGRAAAFAALVHGAKQHPGQRMVAGRLRALLAESRLLDGTERAGRLIQDPYSLRCAPHVLGAADDAAAWIGELLRRELNSADDNPLVDPDGGGIVFGGNFYGGHVALAMDLLKTVAAGIVDLADRQFALAVDSRFNEGLPETLVGYPGSGVKGLQITCSALAALAAQRALPDSVLSRPTEVGNQDKVSMGLNAATNAAFVVGLLELAVAAELVALSNAAAVRGEERLSGEGKRTLDVVRGVSPVLAADRPLDGDVARLAALFADRPWEEETP